jgi:hypothetical protein
MQLVRELWLLQLRCLGVSSREPAKTYESEEYQEKWQSTHLSIVGLLVKVKDFNWEYGQEVTLNWSSWFEVHPCRLLRILEDDLYLEEALADLKSPESILGHGHAQPSGSSSSSSQNHAQAERELCKDHGQAQAGLERQRTDIRDHCVSVRSIQAAQAQQQEFLEAVLDMKWSLCKSMSHWEPFFLAMVEASPGIIRSKFLQVQLVDEEVSIKWEPTVRHMSEATGNAVLD